MGFTPPIVVSVEQRMSAAHEAPNPALVAQLLREQAPHLSTQPVTETRGSGSSNWVLRLGLDHAVRLPRRDSYVDDLLKEAAWLPRLGPELNVPVPEVVFLGRPSPTFPRPWTVVTWVPGELPGRQSPSEQDHLAVPRTVHPEPARGRHPRSTCRGRTLGVPLWRPSHRPDRRLGRWCG